MSGVTFLLIITVAGVAVLGLLPALQADRREQERAGLFGAGRRRRRLAADHTQAEHAARRAREEDEAAIALDATASRLVRDRPAIRRLDEAERGWWWMAFADGTVVLVQACSQRALRRLRRRIDRLPVTLAGVSRQGDRCRLVLEAWHRSIPIDALVVTVAR